MRWAPGYVCTQALQGMHTLSGLPWWATFAASTVVVRAALLPLVCGEEVLRMATQFVCAVFWMHV
jgi:membrane protein insertase Oxa1/YidC/SpoIIIJ